MSVLQVASFGATRMRKDLLEIVCCPVHKCSLELSVQEEDDHGDVVTGNLRCAECKFDYPIEQSIPNLLPPEYHGADA